MADNAIDRLINANPGGLKATPIYNIADVDLAWGYYGTAVGNSLLPYTFGSTVANPIQGEVRFLLMPATSASFDPITGVGIPATTAHYEMSFWDGTQWVSTGTGGTGTGATADDTTILLSGCDPTFPNNYSIARNPDNTIQYETWRDTSTARLRRRVDFTYSAGEIATARTRVYSAANGTTVVGEMTGTYNYNSGLLSDIVTTRTV